VCCSKDVKVIYGSDEVLAVSIIGSLNGTHTGSAMQVFRSFLSCPTTIDSPGMRPRVERWLGQFKVDGGGCWSDSTGSPLFHSRVDLTGLGVGGVRICNAGLASMSCYHQVLATRVWKTDA
jgi:hypothetical protein